MKNKIIIFLILIIIPLTIISILSKSELGSNYRKFHLYINNKDITLILASTTESRELGLGGRESLPDNTAMLFTFEKAGKYGIWMKGMKFPIDIIWLDENYKINTIKQNISPYTYPDVFTPVGNSSFILETKAGFVKKNNLQVGNVLNLSLK